MARPLDGIVLLAYTRRLKLSKETHELLTHIRSSPPSRTPGARRGNMPVWYPSKKMQCIIKAESTKVEFPFLLTAEHDDDVLEIWDQPPSIPLEYLDKHGHLQRPMHTADYFVFRYCECGWVECKPAQELLKQAEKRPNRYMLDEHGIWRCLPGEAFAAKYGLTYRVWSSDQINWAVQESSLFLEDYYQDLERLNPPQPRGMEGDQIERILKAIPAEQLRDRLFFRLLSETGLRVSEGLSLYVEDLDLSLDNEHLTVVGKGGKRRMVLLDDPRLVQQLRTYLKRMGYQHGPLFRAEKNGRGGPLRYRSMQERWSHYCSQAGVACTLHQLRHSHATELINGGVSLPTIRKRLGHKNLQTTLRYAEQADNTADAEIRQWRRRCN